MRELRLFILTLLLLTVLLVGFPMNNSVVTGEWTPEIEHTPPSDITTGEAQEISITVEAYNVTSVYFNWVDVEGRGFQRRMERDPQDNITWTYIIPAQEREGEIRYNFTVRKELTTWYYPEEGYISLNVEGSENHWTDYRYIMILGGVLLTSLILVELIRRRTPSGYKKDYKQPMETDEDRWRRL